MDPRVERMADVVIQYSVEAGPGDWVVIDTPFAGRPLALALVDAALRVGAYPTVLYADDEVTESIVRDGNDDQLSFLSPIRPLVVEQAGAYIRVAAPDNTRTLSDLDAERMAVMQAAARELAAIRERRFVAGVYRTTVCGFPSHAAAQDAGMSLRGYEDFVFNACKLNRPDPIEAWHEQDRFNRRLIDWLQGKEELRITGQDTDLRIGLRGSIWRSDTGHANFPGGEAFTAPDASATEGTIRFNLPCFYSGKESTDVRLTFSGGSVVEASAATGEDYLHAMLGMDDGARRLGEFAFGTNEGIAQFTRSVLFDEKMGGTLHMALGYNVAKAGHSNNSALHWDMIYNLRENALVTVDGQPFSRNGQFVV